MVLFGILLGIFLLFSVVGGVYMYFYAVVRDHSRKTSRKPLGKGNCSPPGYSRGEPKEIIAGEKYIKKPYHRGCQD